MYQARLNAIEIEELVEDYLIQMLLFYILMFHMSQNLVDTC